MFFVHVVIYPVLSLTFCVCGAGHLPNSHEIIFTFHTRYFEIFTFNKLYMCMQKLGTYRIILSTTKQTSRCYVLQTAGPLEEKGMVMNVMEKAFDVFILRLGVTKRVYCDVCTPLVKTNDSCRMTSGLYFIHISFL